MRGIKNIYLILLADLPVNRTDRVTFFIFFFRLSLFYYRFTLFVFNFLVHSIAEFEQYLGISKEILAEDEEFEF